MKTFLFLLGLVAAGLFGYSFEPDLRLSLTGKSPVAKKAKPPIVATKVIEPVVRPAPEPPAPILPATNPAIDLASIPADQLPAKVLLKSNVDFTDTELDLKMTITAGNQADVIRLDGQNVVISPGGGKYQVSVPISQTDLLERISTTAPAAPEIVATPEPAPAPETTPEPKAPLDPEPTPEPPTALEPTPEPVTDPTPAAPANPGGIVAIMQASIKAGEIEEFTFAQVLDWKASEAPETVDGETYQTGIASYKAETVFGEKTIQAKALIKDGKVIRWLWPKSGMVIK